VALVVPQPADADVLDADGLRQVLALVHQKLVGRSSLDVAQADHTAGRDDRLHFLGGELQRRRQEGVDVLMRRDDRLLRNLRDVQDGVGGQV
jgi:hypothetical protein